LRDSFRIRPVQYSAYDIEPEAPTQLSLFETTQYAPVSSKIFRSWRTWKLKNYSYRFYFLSLSSIARSGEKQHCSGFCPRRTVFVGDYEVAVIHSLFVCCRRRLKPFISFEPDFRSSWNFTSVIFMSMGAYVPIFRKIHYLLLPFAYYFCSNI